MNGLASPMFVTFLKFAEGRAASSTLMAEHSDWIAREGKRRGVMLSHGWLFPGRSRTELHRAVQEAADVAGIHKRVPCLSVSLYPPGHSVSLGTNAEGERK